jgi:hypothetical protein
MQYLRERFERSGFTADWYRAGLQGAELMQYSPSTIFTDDHSVNNSSSLILKTAAPSFNLDIEKVSLCS